MFDEARDLYQSVILDRSRAPRHATPPSRVDKQARADNRLCGDHVDVMLQCDGDVITEIGFAAQGCAISVASADLMAEAVRGHAKSETRGLIAGLRHLAETGTALPGYPHLTALGCVHGYRSRIRCATLAWDALELALKDDRI